jgi:hypothetical protein
VIDGRFVMENRAIPGQDEAADNVRAQKQFEGVMWSANPAPASR